MWFSCLESVPPHDDRTLRGIKHLEDFSREALCLGREEQARYDHFLSMTKWSFLMLSLSSLLKYDLYAV